MISMSSRSRPSSWSLFLGVFISVFVALVLTVVQLPGWLFYYWPDWIAIVVAYWALVAPKRIGPYVGFIIGTLLEVLFVRKFGVMGFGLATLAFIVNSTSQQLRVLSIWQQMISMGVFIGFFKLLTGWLSGMVAGFTITAEYWYSLLGTVVIWPFAFILLEELRRAVRIR
ncbi:MAG: rod shape-determining protein MreD [Arenicella sp.]|jgi:rod shape-determining protein MreD